MKVSRSLLIELTIGLIISVFLYTGIAHAAACLSCDPQCVKYARDRSGIQCKGNAGTWPSCSVAKHTDKPKTGYVIALSSPAHVIYVEKGDSDCKDKKCSIKISHANWSNGCACGTQTCCIEKNVKATYNMKKSELSIKEGRLPGTYKVSCILKKK